MGKTLTYLIIGGVAVAVFIAAVRAMPRYEAPPAPPPEWKPKPTIKGWVPLYPAILIEGNKNGDR